MKTSGKGKKSVRKFLDSSNYVKWSLLAGVTIIFTLVLSPNLIITEHSYNLGDFAERDIKAPEDFLVEDKEATAQNRRRAADAVLTVYDYDVALSSKLSQRVTQAFAEIRNIIETETKAQSEASAKVPEVVQNNSGKENSEFMKHVRQAKKGFEEKLGITVSKGAYELLEQEAFSKKISELIYRILAEILKNGVVANKEILLRKVDKGIILRTVGTKSEAEVHGLKRFYGLDQAQTMVRIVGQPLIQDLNYTLRNLIVDICQRLIQPNITLNRNETEERKKKAAEKINPTLYKIRAGEMLLREGEVVTELQLLKLKMLKGQARKEQLLASSIGAAMIILSLLMTTHILYTENRRQSVTQHNKNLLFITCVLIIFMLLSKLSASLSGSVTQQTPFSIPASSISLGIPLASGAMAVCLFLGLQIAIPFAMVTAACTALIFHNSLEIFIYFFINSSMAAYWVQNCRERKVFIKAGLKLALLNIILSTSIGIYMAEFSGFKLLWDWAFAFMGGIGAGIVTAGIAPLLEIAFDYKTDITLY